MCFLDTHFAGQRDANDGMITMYDARWVLELLGTLFINYIIVYPVHLN